MIEPQLLPLAWVPTVKMKIVSTLAMAMAMATRQRVAAPAVYVRQDRLRTLVMLAKRADRRAMMFGARGEQSCGRLQSEIPSGDI